MGRWIQRVGVFLAGLAIPYLDDVQAWLIALALAGLTALFGWIGRKLQDLVTP